jgi:hypothetical protein
MNEMLIKMVDAAWLITTMTVIAMLAALLVITEANI